jgi:DMSO reductase anchor subunit/ferredoxin
LGFSHWLVPFCLTGCPVSAYTKDKATGIVDHDSDLCIGCQYCIWNCSYGVPQFNAERGVVGKCDMCHGRLDQGDSPACVSACPEEAIRIEIVDIARWRANHAAADAPGLADANDSLSTTRLTLPPEAGRLERVDTHRVEAQPVHWSLVIMLVVTQLAAGALATLAVVQLFGTVLDRLAVLPSILAGIGALLVAPAHLGRPIYAWRAVRNWRTSWLSREVIAFGLFMAAGTAYAASCAYGLPGAPWLAALAAVWGFAGIVSSARIYMVPARPAWNTVFTLVDFLATGAVLGTWFVLATKVVWAPWILVVAIAATVCQLANSGLRLWHLAGSAEFEKRGAAELLARRFHLQFAARIACSLLALVPVSPLLAFLFALGGEFLGRYLFFSAVVPKSMAGAFLAPKGAAA